MSSLRIVRSVAAASVAALSLSSLSVAAAGAADAPAEALSWATFVRGTDGTGSAADNFRWYVTTAPIQADEVGDTIKVVAKSTRTID
ncbi:hypothetical protein ACTQ49_14580 [Luteococcus sp. Sow4_B9]|uniref:hypothetical protein n=1 Tax=Luteococcus sp. Sow4_B9 TaxID=3438792 RepID=UPI003F9DD70F